MKPAKDGEFTVTINAACDSAKGERAKFKFTVDGALVGKETTLEADEAKDYTFTVKLKEGERTLGIEFTNDTYKEGEYDSNLYVHAVSLKSKE